MQLLFVLGYFDAIATEIAMKKRNGISSKELTHGIATLLAVCGLGMIIVAPLDFALYGIAMFGLAIALYVIVAAQCHDKRTYKSALSAPPRRGGRLVS